MGEADKPPRRKRATGLTSEERRERRFVLFMLFGSIFTECIETIHYQFVFEDPLFLCRRKSNRESARRSRVRKLEETHESETAIATLQNRINAQAKMLSVATEHLESMKACLSHQETQVGNLCDGVRLTVVRMYRSSCPLLTSHTSNCLPQSLSLCLFFIHTLVFCASSTANHSGT